jgi:ribosomal protein S18 acetylase RimI-like enzyme
MRAAAIPAMTVKITYRALAAAELPAARELWSTADGVELSEGDDVHELLGYLERNPGMSFAAFAGSRMIGAVLGGHDGRRGYLYHLAVAADHRGTGVGRELVERSLAEIRRHGIRRSLILVAQGNDGGAKFWSRVGWEGFSAGVMGIDL